MYFIHFKGFKDQVCAIRELHLRLAWLKWQFLTYNGISNNKMQNSIMEQNNLAREHTPLGEVSLCSWPTVLPVWIQLLHFIQIRTYFLFWSNPVLLSWRPTVQWSFPPQRVYSDLAAILSLTKMFSNLEVKPNYKRNFVFSEEFIFFWRKHRLTTKNNWTLEASICAELITDKNK